MDKEKFDYHPISTFGVFFKTDKGVAPHNDYPRCLHPFMQPLIETVAKRHPSWTFDAYAGTLRREMINYTYFDVYQGREKLGTISMGYRGGFDTYEMTSPSLVANSGRKRRPSTQTADIKKAAKLVTEHIKPKTQLQAVAKARNQLDELIISKRQEAEREAIRDRNNLWQPLLYLLAADWDSFEPRLRQFGAAQATLDRFIPTMFNHKEMVKLANLSSANKGTYILIDDNGNYLTRQGDLVSTFTSSDLSADLRTKLGMLKLCEDNTVRLDLGARVDSRTFYIVDE